MLVKGWNNGSPLPSGAGYGLRITIRDRDRIFDRAWDEVVIDLGSRGHTEVALSESFWATCSELRSAAIGRWMLGHRLAPWPKGLPPTLELRQLVGPNFQLIQPE